MKNIKNWTIILAAVAVGLFIGWLLFNGTSDKEADRKTGIDEHELGIDYTCSMHPNVRQSEPGQCPICGMDLIPVSERGTGSGDALEMSEAAMKVASIQTAIVGSDKAVREIELSGKLAVDEREVSNQTIHFPGRIDRLYVNFEGEEVRTGQLIAKLYSPELITAQEELLEAYRFREKNEVLWNAAQNKLRLWKLPDRFIDDVIKMGSVETEIPIYAEGKGVVIKKRVNEGDHLMEGSVLYTLANLSKLWVLFDAYETDISLIRIGAQVHFSVPSIPGEHFHANVTYIDPVMDPSTRTISVRAEVSNRNGLLKPEMFADGIIVASPGSGEKLQIPKSSVLWTGSRSIVYVADVKALSPTFSMREIETGTSSGDYIEVISGLSVGEEIVVNGVFSVDAAAQLHGKPSMMNREVSDRSLTISRETTGNNVPVKEIPHIFKEQLKDVYLAYINTKDAFIRSDPKAVTEEVLIVSNSLKKVDSELLKGDDLKEWISAFSIMTKASTDITASDDIETQREAFSRLTTGLITSIKYFGLSGEKVYYQYCPMAFNNKGDFWLSTSDKVLNPYFGDRMLNCGEVVEIIEF